MARNNYDSEFCGSLPINFINQTQSYGFLIICDHDFTIIQMSDNIESFTGLKPADILNTTLLQSLTSESAKQLKEKISASEQARVTVNVQLTGPAITSSDFLVIANKREDLYLLEFEPDVNASTQFVDVYQRIREITSSIQQSADMESSLEVAVKELKKFSGFDKVMIYKFDEDWNGHVLAESMEAGMESYKGITFPASDIPKQARELYFKNPYRQIPDISYVPSKLYPIINPSRTGFTDLSDCNIRGVAKVHLEYLNNMQVKASMSTRILKDNQLWGLIACHHRSPKFLNYDECSVFELLSGIVSAKLSSAELHQILMKNEKMQGIQARIVEDIFSENLLIHGIEKCGSAIMHLLNCTGIAYVNESHKKCYGECPDQVQLSELIIYLQTKNITSLFMTSNLADHYEDALRFSALGSGLIVFPIVPDKGEFILCFRPELEQSIDWGGNPNEAINFSEDKQQYHPRNSFALWREDIKHTSAPFTQFEITAAGDLQRVFLELRLKDRN